MAFAFTLAGLAVFTTASLAAGTALLTGLAVTFAFAGSAMFAFAVLAAGAAFSVIVRMAFALTLAGLAVFTTASLAAGTAFFTGLAVTFAFAGSAMFAFAVLAARAFCCCINQTHCRHQCHRTYKKNRHKRNKHLLQHRNLLGFLYLILYQ
jgi:signal transduction histidine kinase